MDFEVFTALASSDQAAIDQSTESIINSSKDPSYIFYLFDSLNNPTVTSSPRLQKTIIILVAKFISDLWPYSQSEQKEEPFWSQDQQNLIIDSLFSLLFTVPYDLRAHIIEPFRKIILKTFPDSISIASRLHSLLREKENLQDVSTILHILYYWCKGYHDRPESEESEKFTMSLLSSLVQVMEIAVPSIESNESAQFLVMIASKSIRRLNKIVSKSDNFNVIFDYLTKFMLVEGSSQSIILMRSKIIKIFISFIGEFFSTKTRKQDDEKRAFADMFKQNYIPTLFDCTVKSLDYPADFSLSGNILYLFYQFIFYGICTEHILTPDFIVHVLLKYSILSETELEEAESLPEQYISFYLSDEAVDVKTPRCTIASIIQTIVSKYSIVDELYSLITDFSDPSTLEARSYLMYVYLDATNTLQKDNINAENKKLRKQRKNDFNPLPLVINPHIEIDVINYLIKILPDCSANLQSTLLLLLSKVLPHTDASLGHQLAESIILNTESLLVIACASKLLIKCTESVSPTLLRPLIEAASMTRIPSIVSAIKLLCHSSMLSPELIKVLFDITYDYLAQDDEYTTVSPADGVLEIVYNMIDELEDDHELLYECHSLIYSGALRCLLDFPSNACLTNLFLILSSLSMKLSHMSQHTIEAFDSVASLLQSDVGYYLTMQEVTWYLYPLLTNPNSFAASRKDVFYKLTNDAFDFLFEDPENNPECIPYVLFLGACVIQTLGIGLEWIEHAIVVIKVLNEMSEANEDIYLPILGGLVVFLASVMMLNQDAAKSRLGEEERNFICSWFNQTCLVSQREQKAGAIVLFMLDERELAYELYQAINKPPQEEETEEEEDEVDILVAPYPVPLDNFDLATLFSQ